MPRPRAYDPKAAVLVSRRNLPHYRQDDGVYYVTVRLADSLPATRLRQWHAELEELPPEERKTHVARRMEAWLDRGEGECLLEREGAAELVEKSLKDRDGVQYLLDEYVVMPNHAHVLVMPVEGNELSAIVQAWKGYTAHEINKLLGRTGTVWQLEPFDHIVRDAAALGRFRKYIRNNPQKLPGRRAIVGRGSFAEKMGM
jgi:REP element-mobilizing transposase RayT